MGGRRMEDMVRPGRLVDLDAVPYVPRPLSARFHVGLACDREAGRPFQRHLEKFVPYSVLFKQLHPHVTCVSCSENPMNTC